MALQKEIIDDVGNTSNYHKITHVRIENLGNDKCAILIDVSSYASKSYRDKSVLSVNAFERYTFESSYEIGNVMTLCYEYLKSLPIFEGAIDV